MEEVIPIGDSREFLQKSGLPQSSLVVVGRDGRAGGLKSDAEASDTPGTAKPSLGPGTGASPCAGTKLAAIHLCPWPNSSSLFGSGRPQFWCCCHRASQAPTGPVGREPDLLVRVRPVQRRVLLGKPRTMGKPVACLRAHWQRRGFLEGIDQVSSSGSEEFGGQRSGGQVPC